MTADEKISRYNSFVAPYGDDEQRLASAKPISAWSPGNAAIVQVQPHEVELPAPIVTRQTINTSAIDRAWAFNIETAGLSLIVGVGGLLIISVGWSIPLVSVPALAILFGCAALTWFIAWMWNKAASPDGIGLISVLLHYRLLRYEQRARLDRIDSMMEDE